MKVIFEPLALRLIKHLELSLQDNYQTQTVETKAHRVPKEVITQLHVWAIMNDCTVELDRSNEDKHIGCRYCILEIINPHERKICTFFSEHF